jgi:hypothetical protein
VIERGRTRTWRRRATRAQPRSRAPVPSLFIVPIAKEWRPPRSAPLFLLPRAACQSFVGFAMQRGPISGGVRRQNEEETECTRMRHERAGVVPPRHVPARHVGRGPVWGDPAQRCVNHAGRHHTGPLAPGFAPQRRTRYVPCRCQAYDWPHRPASGVCRWPEPPVERCATPEGTHRWPRWRPRRR